MLFALTLLLSSVSAQYGYGAPASSAVAAPAPVATGASSVGSNSSIHHVLVGANGLNFTPSNISAAIGDSVVFEFHPKAHSVTQSSFALPCFHLADSTGAAIGIDSGFMPVLANATSFPTFVVTVEETTPLWFYCAQGNHCAQGMVFAINPLATGKTFAAFAANAMNATATPAVSNTVSETLRLTASGLAASVGPSTVNTDSTATTATSSGSSATPSSTSTKSAASSLEISFALIVAGLALVV